MKDSPLISVIVPVYNVEGYIADCLKSVLSQSYNNIEVLCVDDCGSDASMEIVERFSSIDSRIKILWHECNRGLGPARNTGIDAATGEYIIFLDSDDMFYPDALEKLLEEAKAAGADVTAGRVIAFPHSDDEKLKAFVEFYNEYDSQAPSGLCRLQIGDFSSPCRKLSVVAHGRLFTADFLKRNNLRFIEQNVAHEDNGFYCKYMSCLPLVDITDIPTVQYRIRPASIMTGLGAKEFKERHRRHMRIVLADARTYIVARQNSNDVDQLLYTLGCLESPLFIFDYGPKFQLQWGKYEKLLRVFNLTLYRERINSKGHKIYQFFGIPCGVNKTPLGLLK